MKKVCNKIISNVFAGTFVLAILISSTIFGFAGFLILLGYEELTLALLSLCVSIVSFAIGYNLCKQIPPYDMDA